MSLEKITHEETSIEKIHDRLTINFPECLNLEQSENLLKYLAEKLRVSVDYNISCHKSIIQMEGEVKTFDVSLKITGQIASRDNFGKFDSFTITDSDPALEIYKVGKLEFSMVSGWDINEYGEEVRELWDDVRETVGKYFESRS